MGFKRLERALIVGFRWYGECVGSRPVLFFLVPLVITIFLIPGLFLMVEDDDVIALFTPYNAPSHYEERIFEQFFNVQPLAPVSEASGVDHGTGSDHGTGADHGTGTDHGHRLGSTDSDHGLGGGSISDHGDRLQSGSDHGHRLESGSDQGRRLDTNNDHGHRSDVSTDQGPPPDPFGSDEGPQVKNQGPQVKNQGPQVTSQGPQVTGQGPQVTNQEPQVTDHGPPPNPFMSDQDPQTTLSINGSIPDSKGTRFLLQSAKDKPKANPWFFVDILYANESNIYNAETFALTRRFVEYVYQNFSCDVQPSKSGKSRTLKYNPDFCNPEDSKGYECPRMDTQIGFIEDLLNKSAYEPNDNSKVRLSYPVMYIWNRPINWGHFLYGAQVNKTNGKLVSAKVAVLKFQFQFDLNEAEAIHSAKQCMRALSEFILSLNDPNTLFPEAHRRGLRFYISNQWFINDEVTSTRLHVLPCVAFTAILVIIFTTITSYYTRSPVIGAAEAILGVLTIGLSLSATFSLLFILGLRSNFVVSMTPLLTLCVGIDNDFLLISAWRRPHLERKKAKERLALSFAEAGPSLTITSINDSLCFAVGCLSDSPAIADFCLFTCVALTMRYLYQLTFFSGAMILINERGPRIVYRLKKAFIKCAFSKEEKITPDRCTESPDHASDSGHVSESDHGSPTSSPDHASDVEHGFNHEHSIDHDCHSDHVTDLSHSNHVTDLSNPDHVIDSSHSSHVTGLSHPDHVTDSSHSNHVTGYVAHSERSLNAGHVTYPTHGHVTNPVAACTYSSPKDDHVMHRFFRRYYSRFLSHRFSRVSITVLFGLYLLLSFIFAARLRIDISVTKLFMDGSPLISHFDIGQRYVFTNMIGNVIVTRPPDFRNQSNVRRFMNFVDALERTPIYSPNPIDFTVLWLRDYLDFSSYVAEPGADFYDYLSMFLEREEYSKYVNDIRFNYTDNGKVQIESFLFTTYYQHATTWDDCASILLLWRAVCRNYSDFGAVVHDYFFRNSYLDQRLTLSATTLQTMGIASLSIVFVTSLLMPDASSMFFICFSSLSVDLGVIAALNAWGSDLDPITMACLLMTIGFSVYYTARICYCYQRADKRLSVQEKLAYTLGSVGWPILQGGLATLISILPLIYVQAYMVRTFFRTIVLVVFVGLLHGLLFMPVLMSLCDRHHQTVERLRAERRKIRQKTQDERSNGSFRKGSIQWVESLWKAPVIRQ